MARFLAGIVVAALFAASVVADAEPTGDPPAAKRLVAVLLSKGEKNNLQATNKQVILNVFNSDSGVVKVESAPNDATTVRITALAEGTAWITLTDSNQKEDTLLIVVKAAAKKKK